MKLSETVKYENFNAKFYCSLDKYFDTPETYDELRLKVIQIGSTNYNSILTILGEALITTPAFEVLKANTYKGNKDAAKVILSFIIDQGCAILRESLTDKLQILQQRIDTLKV